MSYAAIIAESKIKGIICDAPRTTFDVEKTMSDVEKIISDVV